MAQLDFFAVRQDLQDVIDFLYSETDFRIFELYSAFGQDLREFKAFAELDAAFDIGGDKHGISAMGQSEAHGHSVTVQV